jgi:hypothetical protein
MAQTNLNEAHARSQEKVPANFKKNTVQDSMDL